MTWSEIIVNNIGNKSRTNPTTLCGVNRIQEQTNKLQRIGAKKKVLWGLKN